MAQPWKDSAGKEWKFGFATLKASHGLTGTQAGLAEHWAREAPEMAASGIPLVGGCHRLLAGVDVAAQIMAFTDAMRLIGGYRGKLVQLDCEGADMGSVMKWMEMWNLATNHYPVLGYLPDWRESGWLGSDIASYGFAGWWASEYVAGESLRADELFATVTPAQWHPQDGVNPTILQFTSKAIIPGVPGLGDVNAFRGTLTELKALATR